MPRTRKSMVWNHFIKVVEEGNVQCTICNKKMKFFGNTTNLKEHLRRTHPEHIAANDLQNDGYILFVDSKPKAKKLKTLKYDDENESLEIGESGGNENEFMRTETYTIKEAPYSDREGYAASFNISTQEQYQNEPSFSLGSDDFSKVVHTTAYVDKSLLIEELFRYNYALITAPHGFGKSTNWDMVKRFLEIEVGEDGLPRDVRQTNNYKIFRDKKLNITEKSKFCKDNMGQHPVISIDFKPLSHIENHNGMISKFKTVLRRTFSNHRYLMKNAGLLLKSSQELFIKYCDPALSLTLTLPEIEMGFVFLSEMLFLHFKKPALVLIDNYDAFLDSIIFKNNEDADRIINFILSTVKELLKSNQFVDRAYLTGVFPVINSGIYSVSNNFKHFYFLDNHHFCKYYGVTSDEITDLLRKFIFDTGEREKHERIIAEYYGGYGIPSQNLTIYNLWSILNYLDNKRIPLNYWCQSEHYDIFKELFSIREVSDEIQLLLLGISRCTDISKSLSQLNFKILNKYKEHTKAIIIENLLIKILYHLGYLAGNESVTLDQSEGFLKIPNSEIRLEFARILKDTFIEKYLFKERHIRALHFAANAFNNNSYCITKFENFSKAIYELFLNSTYHTYGKTSNDYQNILFTLLACKFCITQSEIYKSNLSPSIDILSVNDSGVGIFIETKLSQKNENDQEVAKQAHRQIIDKKCCEYFDRNFEATMGKICIGICITEEYKIRIACSYHFNIGDDIDTPTFFL